MVFQNALTRHFPSDFLASFPQGPSIAYALIAELPAQVEDDRREMAQAFVQSLTLLWYVLLGVAVVGMGVSLLMRGLPSRGVVHEQWELQDGARREGDSLSQDVDVKEEIESESSLRDAEIANLRAV